MWQLVHDWIAGPLIDLFWRDDSADHWARRFYGWVAAHAYWEWERERMERERL